MYMFVVAIVHFKGFYVDFCPEASRTEGGWNMERISHTLSSLSAAQM